MPDDLKQIIETTKEYEAFLDKWIDANPNELKANEPLRHALEAMLHTTARLINIPVEGLN